MSVQAADLRSLQDQPFELLRALESQIQFARLDSVAGRAEVWTGLGFRIGGLAVVAPRKDVREVIVPPNGTRIPNARPWLLGIANVRGNLLTVVDLAQLVGLGASTITRASRVLVLNAERGGLGFLVDEVLGYRQFNPSDQTHGATATVAGLAPFLLGGFFRDGQTWLALSFHRLAGADLVKQVAW